MFRPTRASLGLQSSKRLTIVCVWRMLRSHHLAYKLYMRHKLRVSRCGGGHALCVGGGHLPWALSLLGGGSGWRISRSERVTCVALEICRIDILLLVLVLLWCWKHRVALARSCIVTGDHCRIGVVSLTSNKTCCVLTYFTFISIFIVMHTTEMPQIHTVLIYAFHVGMVCSVHSLLLQDTMNYSLN